MRALRAPAKSTKTSSAIEPNAANRAICSLPIAANATGTTIAARSAPFSANRPGSEAPIPRS